MLFRAHFLCCSTDYSAASALNGCTRATSTAVMGTTYDVGCWLGGGGSRSTTKSQAPLRVVTGIQLIPDQLREHAWFRQPNSTCRLAFEVPVSSSTAASSATTPVVARALSRYTRNNRAIGTSLRARTSDTRKRCWLHPNPDHVTEQHQTGVPENAVHLGQHRSMRPASCSRKLAKALSSSGATTTTLARMVRRRGKRRRVWANHVPKRRAGTARVR